MKKNRFNSARHKGKTYAYRYYKMPVGEELYYHNTIIMYSNAQHGDVFPKYTDPRYKLCITNDYVDLIMIL